MKIIGLAAAPAGGKSTVAAYLADLGATWINADRIAHDLLGTASITESIRDYFGDQVLDLDGKIDRRKLGSLVFGDDDASIRRLRYLESIIHPPTRGIIEQEIARAYESGVPAVVLDIPLLFESGWADRCDEIWFVDTPQDIQLRAAVGRGWSPDGLARRQARQLAVDEKKKRSTRVLINHGSLSDLRQNVQDAWNDCVKRSAPESSQA